MKLRRSFFIEVVFLRSGGVFGLKHHLKPKKAEIIGVVFLLGGVLRRNTSFLGRSNRSDKNEKQKRVFVFGFCTSSVQSAS